MLGRATILGLLLALLPGTAGAQAQRVPHAVPRAIYPYHVRITRGGELLADRDMHFAVSLAGEHYQPSWQEPNRDACAGPGAARSRRRVEIRMFDPGVFANGDPRFGDHVFFLQVEVVLPATTRARDGSCAAHGSEGNEVNVSQIVDLARGQALRIEAPAGIVIEVRRP